MLLITKVFFKGSLIFPRGAFLLFMGFFVACSTLSPLPPQKPKNQTSCTEGKTCDNLLPLSEEATQDLAPSRNISSVEKAAHASPSSKNPQPASLKAPAFEASSPSSEGGKPTPSAELSKAPVFRPPAAALSQAPVFRPLPVYGAYPKTSVICEGSPVRILYFSTLKGFKDFRCHFQKQKLKVKSLEGLIRVHIPFSLGSKPLGFKGEITCLASSSSKSRENTHTNLTKKTRSLSSLNNTQDRAKPLFQYTYRWEVTMRGKACFYQ